MIKYLEWDSNFFGYPIGKITIETQEELEHLPDMLNNFHVRLKLIYLFTRKNICLKDFPIPSFVIEYLGQTALFQKSNLKFSNLSFEKINVHRSNITNDLKKLALISGEFSRYKKDRTFINNEFEKLYFKWLENSINGSFGDALIVARNELNEIGMITYKKRQQLCDIGLFAVSENSQNKGIGTKLLKYIENICISSKIQTLEVRTQKENINACSFYKRNGFVLTQSQNIYHLWNKNENQF